MVLMLVYMEMAEGLVKPLVILPATIMLLTSFIIISHNVIVPFVLADSFPLVTHFTPVSPYKSLSHPLSPLSPIVSVRESPPLTKGSLPALEARAHAHKRE